MRSVWIPRAAIAAAALSLLAGCETLNAMGSKEPDVVLPPRGQALPPPRPQGTKLTITGNDKGQTFQIRVGDRVAVSLVGVPTAGYEWSAPKPPAILKEAGRLSGPTISDQLYPGYTGGNHWEVMPCHVFQRRDAETPRNAERDPLASSLRASVPPRLCVEKRDKAAPIPPVAYPRSPL